MPLDYQLTASGWVVTGPDQRLYRAKYVGTWAARPSTNLKNGDEAYFTDIGPGTAVWAWNGTRWMPTAPLKIYENTALITGLQQTAEQLLLAIPLKAGILTGKVFHLQLSFGRDGTTDTAGMGLLRLGAAQDLSGTQIASNGISLAALASTARSMGVDTWCRATSATQIEKLGSASSSSSFILAGTSSTLVTPITVADMDAQDTFLCISATMAAATATRPQLGYVALEIEP